MVRMNDRKGLFLVMRADRQQRVVDLMQRVKDRAELEQNVPFKLIQIVPMETSKVIEEFLHS